MVRPGAKSRAQIEAEAAVWLCRLDSEDRSAKTEAGFQDWLRADPAHEEAFRQYGDVWQMMPGAMTASRIQGGATSRRAAQTPKPARWIPASAAAAVLDRPARV